MEMINYIFTVPGTMAFKTAGDEIMLLYDNEKDAEEGLRILRKRFEKGWGKDESVFKRPFWIYLPDSAVLKDVKDITRLIKHVRQNSKELIDNGFLQVDKELAEEMYRTCDMEQVIFNAIERNWIALYYQPIYSTKEKRFTSAEALVRITNEEGKVVPPYDFVWVAEKNGMIIEIGDIVFQKVCEFISSHHLEQLGVRYIEVNLSMVQLMEENLYVRLIEIMKKYNVPGSMIDFEITETSQNKNNAALHRNMRKLIEYGCTFAVDDFGTGLANADYLLEYPFELVKLDRSFVWGARKNEKAQIVLEHAAAMIGKLNLKIVAEGVEDMDQVSKLIDMGCMFLQGYYFEKPIPQERYISFLEDTDNFIREKMPSCL